MAASQFGPIDYSSMTQGPDFASQFTEGLQSGAEVRGLMDKRKAQDQAQALQEQYRIDLQSALDKPTPQSFAALTAKYPQQREAFKQSWDMLSKDQQDSDFKTGAEVYSALNNQRPDVALAQLDKQIQASENSGQDVSDLQNIRKLIEDNPKAAIGHIGLVLSATDPDRWGKIAGEMRASEKAPSELSESQAKASKAATDAKFAESKAVQDLAKGGWEINKLQNDIGISRQNSQIAAINANIAREKNDLKRADLQMKLDDKITARDLKVGEKAAEVTQGRSVIDNMLNTTDRFLNTPFKIVDAAAGPISSKTPTLSSDTADLEELVTTLSSQAFMAQIPALKGMGALSNAEGEKLQASLQNLSLRQSPERLTENVKEAARLMTKARANLSTKFGVPDVVPDTPASTPAPADIDALIIKYGGQ